MKAVLRRLWADNVYLRAIRLMGLVISVGTYSAIVYFFVQELPVLLGADLGFFALDLLIRLGGGVIFAFLAYLPYHTASVAAQKTGHISLFVGISLLVFVAHLWLSISALFFPQGSTSAVGIIFFPFYLAMPVLAFWGLAHIASKQDGKTQ